jgi:hypothetical protein
MNLTKEERKYLIQILKDIEKDTNGFLAACTEPDYSEYLALELDKVTSILKKLEAAND